MEYRLHYAPDNASLIVRLALEELGQPYQTVLVDRQSKAQRRPDYLALNPAGRIPTLETPDGPISETGAILLWLSRRHNSLAPAPDRPEWGAVLNWLFFISNTLHAETVQLFYIHRYGPQAAWPDMRDALRKRIAAHLTLLETEAIARCAGWFCGPSPSVLDLYVAAILRWLALYGGASRSWSPAKACPHLREMCARLERRPSCTALIKAEGMSAHPFTNPKPPNPPEGSAT